MFYAVKLKFYSNFRIFCNGTMQVTEGFEVKHIALTTSQVEHYNPPENNLKKDNFGKLTDPRGISY